MDLSAILPLLLNRDGNGDQTDRMQAMLQGLGGGGTDGQSDLGMLMQTMGGGGEPDRMRMLMNLMNRRNQQKPDGAAAAVGLKAIKGIAPNDIMGMLVKFFA